MLEWGVFVDWVWAIFGWYKTTCLVFAPIVVWTLRQGIIDGWQERSIKAPSMPKKVVATLMLAFILTISSVPLIVWMFIRAVQEEVPFWRYRDDEEE